MKLEDFDEVETLFKYQQEKINELTKKLSNIQSKVNDCLLNNKKELIDNKANCSEVISYKRGVVTGIELILKILKDGNS